MPESLLRFRTASPLQVTVMMRCNMQVQTPAPAGSSRRDPPRHMQQPHRSFKGYWSFHRRASGSRGGRGCSELCQQQIGRRRRRSSNH
jgi:hypothetical protein